MQNVKETIAKDLLKIKAVFFRPEQPFTWASGIKSPIYCDNRLTLSYPNVREDVENALAEIITDRFRDIYPEQELVQKIPTTTLREITRTTTPAVLVEVAYHDEPQDEAWIRDNIDTIARSLVQSLADYFGMEFKEPDATQTVFHWL